MTKKYLLVRYGETIKEFNDYNSAMKALCSDRKAKVVETESGKMKSWTMILD